MIDITDEMTLELSLSLDAEYVPQFTSFTGCLFLASSLNSYRPYFTYKGVGYAGVVWDGHSGFCDVFFRTPTTVIKRHISGRLISFSRKIDVLVDGSIELRR